MLFHSGRTNKVLDVSDAAQRQVSPWDERWSRLWVSAKERLRVSECIYGLWRHVRNCKILLVQVTVVSVVTRSFCRQKNKETEVGEAIQSSSKQNKNMKLCSFVIGQQSSISQSFVNNLPFLSHLHWALPRGEIILILWQKSIGIHCFGLNTFVDVV